MFFMLGGRAATPGYRQGPTAAITTKAAITSRSPKFYAPLTTSSAEDVSGNSLTLTAFGGTPTSGADGHTLGNGVYYEVSHNSSLFETQGSAARFHWVDSEVTVVLEFKVSSLAAIVAIASKAPNPSTAFTNKWWLEVDTSGALHLGVEDSYSRHKVVTPNSTITTGTVHNVAIQFGRKGIQLWVDGGSADNGWPNARHWYGWDHRVRGGTGETARAVGERWVNNHPLRIGHNGWNANGSVTIKHWAVFVSGGNNYNPWTRTGTRMSRSDIEAIHGGSGTDMDDNYRDGGSTITVETTDNLATKLATATAGDTVLIKSGTHNWSGTLTLPDGVRIVGESTNRANNVLDGSSGEDFVTTSGESWLDLTSRDTVEGDLSKGDHTLQLSSVADIQVDDIIFIISSQTYEEEYYGTTLNSKYGDISLRVTSDVVAVRDISGTTLTFWQALRADYPTTERAEIWRLRPAANRLILENLTIKGHTSVSVTGLANYYQALRINGGTGIRIRNCDIHMDVGASATDQKCCTAVSMVDAAIVDSNFDTDSPAVDSTFHPYVFNVSTGRDVTVMNCTFTTDWADGVDPNFDNIGTEIGGGSGFNEHVALRWVEQVDCVITAGHSGIGIGGHSHEAMRVICCDTNKGMTVSRNAHNDEYNGLDLDLDVMNVINGSKAFVHHINVNVTEAARNNMWRQFTGYRIKDSVFSEITHHSTTLDFTEITNCEFVNCDTPFPGS